MRSHRRIRSMASLLLVALLLSGCQIGNTKVVFLKPVGYHQVFKIDKEVCKKKEAKVYLTNYMNIYGNAYGVSLRKQKSVQEDLEQYVKDLTISQLSKIKCMNGIAKEQKIELTKEEEQIAEAAAKEYYESLSKEERKYIGASQSLITKMYSEYLLASKVYQSLIGSVDEEVSDDEARIIEGMQIFVRDSGKADEVKKRLKRGEDFASVAASCNEETRTDIKFGREDMPKEVVKEAFELENEEISGKIKTKEGYYFIKCINKYNKELTDKNKKVILEERKEKAFHTVYDKYVENSSTVLNTKMWDKLQVNLPKDVKTDSFFEVIDRHMEEK